jgi:phenylacetate-CoA ligase
MTLARLLPRFRAAYRAIREMEQREGWSRADLERLQLERLNAVWDHARRHVPHYASVAGRLRLPAQFASLAEFQALVPVLPKEAVRDRPRAFFSAGAGRGFWTRTGGSTGAPMDAFWGRQAHLEMLRGRYRFLAAWGVDIFDRAAFLWGHGCSFEAGLKGRLARWLLPLEDRLRNRIRLSAYCVGPDDLRRYLDRIAAFRPAFLYTYPQSALLLAREAEALRFRCDSLRLVVLSGEPAFPHVIEAVRRAFAAPVAVEYGTIECGFLAGEWPDRTLRVREEHALVETLPRGDGYFDLALTVLDNPSFPLLRYAVGDVTDAPIERPARGLAVLRNVTGRTTDFILSRTGRAVHHIRFDALFKYEMDNVRRFRVHQTTNGGVLVTLELRPGTSLETGALERKVSELVEGYPVSVSVVASVPQTPAGKHRLVVSEMEAPGLAAPAPPPSGQSRRVSVAAEPLPRASAAGSS